MAFLTGHPFPTSDPGCSACAGLPRGVAERPGAPLTLGDVGAAFGAVAAAVGGGSRRARETQLKELAARASDEEREFLGRIIGGEMRTGVSDGLVLEAIAAASVADLAAVRRAALFLGDLSAVAVLRPRRWRGRAGRRDPAPVRAAAADAGRDRRPISAKCCARTAARTALEFKYDGARVQVHRDGDRVAIWTRRLSDVTRSLPDVVGRARASLDGAPFVLDGEVVALDAAGRPLPFQELMRRFRRVHGVEALVREMPLAAALLRLPHRRRPLAHRRAVRRSAGRR